MKILIPTIGSRGDIQPYISLAYGLIQAGHQVTVASHPSSASLAEAYHIPYHPIGPDIDLGLEIAKMRGNSRAIDGGFIKVMKFSFDMLEKAHPDIMAAAEDTELIIVSHTAAGSIEADLLRKPAISVTLHPQAIPNPDPKQSILVKGFGKIIGAAMGLVMTRPLNQIRKRLGMSPMGPTGITSPRLNLIPCSPEINPPLPYWEERHQMTGYWLPITPAGWQADADLEAFLSAGKKPMVISLGAMSLSPDDAAETADLVLSALRQTGVRAIIQGWNEYLTGKDLGDDILHAGSIPHTWLFQRAAAVVHHGGFGTTASAFAAGIPQLIIPHIIDQFVWGNVVQSKTAGPKPISRAKLTTENLSHGILECLQNNQMISTASELGSRIRQEDGITKAIDLIESIHFD
jgi:UDP:flavonoid glycosyltransferase YjiC (YdhE family)